MLDFAKQIVFNPATAVATELIEYAQKFEQIITTTGNNGKQIDVLFVWEQTLDGIIHLVTAIPTSKC